MEIYPYLLVKNGKESIELYKELFGAKLVQHMPFTKEMGIEMGFPEDLDYENSTMHAELDIGGAKIMLSDNPMNKQGSGNVQVYVNFKTKKDLDKLYEKIKKRNFALLIPYEKTFWGSWFLSFEDSNGIGWQCGYDIE